MSPKEDRDVPDVPKRPGAAAEKPERVYQPPTLLPPLDVARHARWYEQATRAAPFGSPRGGLGAAMGGIRVVT
jgi:hypothetical protein